jgi:hypothetical protein
MKRTSAAILGIGITVCAASANASEVGGHVGVAMPIVDVNHLEARVVGKGFLDVAAPIGVTVKLTDHVAFDFETIVVSHLRPQTGTTGLVVDPGLVVDLGPFAVGGRVAFQIGQSSNIGFIALVHKGFPIGGSAAVFLEAAFPTFVVGDKPSAGAVLHTGVSF